MVESFNAMRGERVMEFVAEKLTYLADARRAFLEASVRYGGAPPRPEEYQDIRALEAAREAIRFASVAGLEARTKNRQPPEWVIRMASQMRLALVDISENEEV